MADNGMNDMAQNDDVLSVETVQGDEGGQNGNLPKEIYSKKIKGRSRVFFIDLKESSYGKFLKVSEKSRGGQKTTVMMDQEDIPALIEALEEIKELL